MLLRLVYIYIYNLRITVFEAENSAIWTGYSTFVEFLVLAPVDRTKFFHLKKKYKCRKKNIHLFISYIYIFFTFLLLIVCVHVPTVLKS